jgi:lipopolysaccharide biosynthesis protein
VQSFERPDPRAIGFDAAVEFPPNLTTPLPITSGKQLINPHFSGEVLDWRTMAAEIGRRANNGYLTYSAVNPGWDNEARRPSKGRVFQHSSPGLYQDWLAQSIANQLDEGATPPLIFINAWNEWAEGATLEPTAALGYANLQATRQALGKSLASSTTPSALRYCATIHVWYFEALDEILSFLGQSGLNWYIVVTTSADLESDVRTKIASYGFSSHVVLVDNRGRDILPFLQLCSQLYNEGVDVVLKLHTKRSLHRNDGDLWRRELLEQLLGENRANTIISAFQQNSTLGLVAAEGHILPLTSFWGASKEVVESVVDQLGLNAPSSESVFASGSMFWIRLDAIRTLFDGHLYEHDFEEETGQIDGTLSHALERMFCIVVESRDFSVESAAAVCQTLERKVSDYPFARRTLT